MDNEPKRKDIEAIQYIDPIDVYTSLDITSSTLRKYSALLEKYSNDSNYFARNSQKARLYNKENVATIKRLIKLKQSGSITLENATRQVLNDEANGHAADTAVHPPRRLNEQEKQIKMLYEIVKKQSEQINEQSNQIGQLKDTVQSLTDSHMNTTKQFNELLEAQKTLSIEQTKPVEPSTDKKGFFSRLFKI